MYLLQKQIQLENSPKKQQKELILQEMQTFWAKRLDTQWDTSQQTSFWYKDEDSYKNFNPF